MKKTLHTSGKNIANEGKQNSSKNFDDGRVFGQIFEGSLDALE